MEQLDNKYFERVIAALKEAKAQQNIEINDSFRQSLRSSLVDRALQMEAPPTPGWADFVLNNRYLFGGVPVFAALVLVAMAALNNKVPVVNEQLIAETPTVVTQSNVPEAAITETTVPVGIQTFSADLVMPPADVLAARERYLAGETTVPYTFFDKAGQEVQIKLPALPTTTKTIPTTTVEVVTPIESGKGSVVVEDVPPVIVVPVQEPVIVPKENNGKVVEVPPVIPAESSGKVVVEPVYQEPKATEQPVVQTVKTTDAVVPIINTTPVVISPVVTPTVITPVTTPVTTAPTVEVKSQPVEVVPALSNEYLNTVELQTEVAPKVNLQYTLTAMPDTQILAADRIYYSGNNRDALVAVVLDSLKTRAGTLSRDYYVNVVKFVDGTYRATLYEYGKAKQLLVIAEQRGGLKVVTEVVY